MIADGQYDYSNLTEKISGLTGALLGRGASAGDLQRVLKVRVGKLHQAVGDAIGPATRENAFKRVEFDVKRHLTAKPDYINPLFNGGKMQESESYSEFTWLTAGNGKNGKFLLGINNEDIQTGADAATALALLRAGQKARDRGDAYQTLGQRGQSKKSGGSGRINIIRLNRVKVTKAAYNAVLKNIEQSTGELRAAFYAVAKHYAPKIKVPAWLNDRIERVLAKGKSKFTDTLTPGNSAAYIESTITAPGVISNAALRAKIQGAIGNEAEKVFAIYKKVISGYKYKFETGQTFRSDIDEEGVI